MIENRGIPAIIAHAESTPTGSRRRKRYNSSLEKSKFHLFSAVWQEHIARRVARSLVYNVKSCVWRGCEERRFAINARWDREKERVKRTINLERGHISMVKKRKMEGQNRANAGWNRIFHASIFLLSLSLSLFLPIFQNAILNRLYKCLLAAIACIVLIGLPHDIFFASTAQFLY